MCRAFSRDTGTPGGCEAPGRNPLPEFPGPVCPWILLDNCLLNNTYVKKFHKIKYYQEINVYTTMTADDDLSRIGISLPDNLLRQFDEILDVREYHSRSEGVRDAIRIYNINYQWLADTKSPRKGVFTLVYDYTQADLFQSLTDIRDQYTDLIKVSFQRQVTKNRRLEILIVQGESSRLKALSEQLATLKDIESVRMTTVALDG